jgi:hypothetical protein
MPPESNMTIRISRRVPCLPVLRLPEPTLARSRPIPTGTGWRYEPKLDGPLSDLHARRQAPRS